MTEPTDLTTALSSERLARAEALDRARAALLTSCGIGQQRELTTYELLDLARFILTGTSATPDAEAEALAQRLRDVCSNDPWAAEPAGATL